MRARLRRGGLRRGPFTNDRRPTVRLSPAEIATIRAGIRPHHPESTPDSAGRPDERDRTIAALEAERDAARLAAAKAEGESGTLREQVGAERARADRAEAAGAEARALADRRLLEVAEGEAEALRRPFWRRWLG